MGLFLIMNNIELFLIEKSAKFRQKNSNISFCRKKFCGTPKCWGTQFENHCVMSLFYLINYALGLFKLQCLKPQQSFKNLYRQSGWLCTRWGEIAQSLNFKYLHKSHCKSYELLWVLYNWVSLKIPQQFVGFAVTHVKIFKV